MTNARRDRIRRGVAVTLIVLFGVLAPFAVVASWARATVLETDRYVVTIDALAADPAIRDAAADAITPVAARRLAELGVQPPAGQTLDEVVDDAVRNAIASDQFQTVWDEANRFSHRQLVLLLTGESVAGVHVTSGTVVLDLSAILTAVESQLAGMGYTVELDQAPGSAPIELTLIESDEVGTAQTVARLLDRADYLLPIVALALVGVAIVVAPNRWRALRRIGVGLAIGMLALGGLLLAGRFFYLRALDGAVPRDAAAALFDIVTRLLWTEAIVLFVAGVLLVALAAAGERRHAPGVNP